MSDWLTPHPMAGTHVHLVIFSIVDGEWPAVHARLAAALSPARPLTSRES